MSKRGRYRKAMAKFMELPEADRVAQVKQSGRVPDQVAGAIPDAPARGGLRLVHRADEETPMLVCADVFDRMARDARRARRAEPFSPAQVAMARHYRDLVERYSSAGVRCSSLEALRSSSGGGSFIDAVLRDRQEIDVIRARIGDGAGLSVRRQSGSGRRSIRDRSLVDAVCLDDASLSEVLDRHGWAISSSVLGDARSVLADALDRMVGPQVIPRIQVVGAEAVRLSIEGLKKVS